MVNGRLFQRVAVAFPKQLLLCVTPCIFGTVFCDSDSELRDVVANKERLVPSSTEGQSYIYIYIYIYISDVVQI